MGLDLRKKSGGECELGGSVYGARCIRRCNFTKDLGKSLMLMRELGRGVPAGITAGRKTNLEEVEGQLRTAGLDLSGWISISTESEPMV